jgi:hypothetical protein
MPLEFSVEPAPGPEDVLVTTAGTPTLAELRSFIETLQADDSIPIDARILIDHRAVDFTQLSYEDVETRAQHLVVTAQHGGKVAVVLGSTVAYGLYRQLELMAGDALAVDMHLFRSVDDARAWLAG